METDDIESTSLDTLLEKVHGAARDGMVITLYAILHNRLTRSNNFFQESLQRSPNLRILTLIFSTKFGDLLKYLLTMKRQKRCIFNNVSEII